MNDLLILAALLPGPKHGYRLKREAGLMFGPQREGLHNNVIYPLLRRFTAAGWVKRQSAAGERGQTRKLYSLTARGRAEIVRRVAEFSEQDARSPSEFLVRVGLFECIHAPARERVILLRAQAIASRRQRLRQLQAAMEIGGYGREVLKFAERQAALELAWLRRLRKLARPASRAAKTRAAQTRAATGTGAKS